MRDFETIKSLIGGGLNESDLGFVDCYVRPQLGLFIPTEGQCGYSAQGEHTHPTYMVIICFDLCAEKQSHYYTEITSPNVLHRDVEGVHYYCLLIDKDYFEARFKLYSDKLPVFNGKKFEICSDILKALNTFAFEYSKSMLNSEITLDAQTEIITHWIIRSLFGETLDMRAVSDDYSVARAQHYIEQHFTENISVAKLASLGYVSESSLNRRFKKETSVTPFEYLIEIRIAHAKNLLRRKQISITEIAMRCGFGDSSHFSSCFTRRIGISPTEYREKYVG